MIEIATIMNFLPDFPSTVKALASIITVAVAYSRYRRRKKLVRLETDLMLPAGVPPGEAVQETGPLPDCQRHSAQLMQCRVKLMVKRSKGNIRSIDLVLFRKAQDLKIWTSRPSNKNDQLEKCSQDGRVSVSCQNLQVNDAVIIQFMTPYCELANNRDAVADINSGADVTVQRNLSTWF